MMRRLPPYLVAIGGVVAVTVAIAVVMRFGSVSGLSAFYLLMVLWIAARWGRGPALLGSIGAFLMYDYFFVPPVGTFAVRGPAELLELVLLLAVALVTSQLAASLHQAQRTAEIVAADSRSLYELAAAALRTSGAVPALTLVAERARELPSVRRFAVVGVDSGTPVSLAGDVSEEELSQAAWCFKARRAIGIAVRDGAVRPMVASEPAQGTAFLPLASGVAVVELDAGRRDELEMRTLAALIGLADLLLDRRRGGLEAERARGLEASDRMKAAILSSLSHELKSPLAALRAGLTALVSPSAGLPYEQRELLAGMDAQAARLDRMVGDMLALSRLEAGVELDREPQSFAEVTAGALQEVRRSIGDRRVVLDLPDDLPPVQVDELQARRLMTNLLENALEWTPAHGVIEVGARCRDGRLEAWVENEGAAIPPADVDRVFDTFWTRRARGTGLGLAICRRVVEAHGGAIAVESRRRGPRFTFTLPLAEVRAGA